MVPGSHFQGHGCQGPMSQGRKSQVPGSHFQVPKVPESQVPGLGFQVAGPGSQSPRFRVLGPGSWVSGSQVLGLRVPSSEFWFWVSGSWISESWVPGPSCWVSGPDFRLLFFVNFLEYLLLFLDDKMDKESE